MLIDLQLHSTYSDGYLTPTELAYFLKKQGVKVASLTDHNTVSGLGEFKSACRRARIKTIVGLELYVKIGSQTFNILWFNFDHRSPDLHDMLRASQLRRRKKARFALKAMLEAGFKVDVNKIIDKYNHYVPLNHLVDEVLAIPENQKKARRELRLKVIRESDIIDSYLRNRGVGKLKNSYIDVKKVLKLRQKIGGQIILCHPAKHHAITPAGWERFKKLGFDGVEKLSPHHSYGAVMYIQHLARQLDFIETGGSDFHRFEGDNHLVQHAWQYFRVQSEMLRSIEKIIG